MFPRQYELIEFIKETKFMLFEDHYYIEDFALPRAKERLFSEIYRETKSKELSNEIVNKFYDKIPQLKELLKLDAEFYYKSDPSATSIDEIILAYSSFSAVLIYRIANSLINEGLKLIPRMLSEYAHQISGIDIHPKAKIGKSFFIDHGTGVVIGETTIIKDNVKIYQGVTLGALTTRDVLNLRNTKRHPTIMSNVTIYANATILGGSTIISENKTISGHSIITKSI